MLREQGQERCSHVPGRVEICSPRSLDPALSPQATCAVTLSPLCPPSHPRSGFSRAPAAPAAWCSPLQQPLLLQAVASREQVVLVVLQLVGVAAVVDPDVGHAGDSAGKAQ